MRLCIAVLRAPLRRWAGALLAGLLTAWVPAGCAQPAAPLLGPVDLAYFGLVMNREGAKDQLPWPTVAFGSWRLWDTYVAWPNLEPERGRWAFAVLDKLVAEARDHGVEVRGVSVNHSVWDCTLEFRPDGGLALRLGFRQIKGMREEDASWIAGARGNGYPDVESLWRRAGVRPDTLERLAEADAFAALGLTRRDALWAAKALKAPAPLPLFGPDGEGGAEPAVTLPQMTLGQEVIEDYLSLRLSLRAHPMELLRPRLPESLPHDRLSQAKGRVTVTGLVITRQRPGTAAGVIFLTLEDETGTANVIVWKQVYELFRKAVIAGRLVRITGRIQRDGPTTHLIAERVEDVSPLLATLGRPVIIDANDGRADETKRPVGGSAKSSAHHPREQAKKLFPSRDFH